MNNFTKITTSLTLALLVFVGALGTTLAASAPAPTKPGSTFEERLNQRKAERGIVLDEKDQTRLVNTCITGQTKMRLIQVELVPAIANRIAVYQKIDAKLLVTIGSLKLASKDTFKLEKDRLLLADKTAQFQVLATNLTQAIDDTEIMNCKADPAGFRAMMETIKLYYTDLQKQSFDSRDFLVNTIKPELAIHADDLQVKTPTSGRN